MSHEPRYRARQTTPLARQRRSLRRGPGLPPDWRELLVLAITRAAAAAGFVLAPGFQGRLGDATLTAVAAALAAGVGGTTVAVWHSLGGMVRRDLLADALSLACLVPTIVVASAIQLADARFGGRAENVLAAMGAVAAAFAIVTFTGASERGARFGSVALAALPGALSVAAIIGGTTAFAGGQIWQGLSLAWMVSAGVTLVYLLLPAVRGVVAGLAYAVFATAMLVLPDRQVTVSAEADLDVALLTLAAVGAIVVLIGLAPSSRTAVRSEGR